jgi:hypothetical protein
MKLVIVWSVALSLRARQGVNLIVLSDRSGKDKGVNLSEPLVHSCYCMSALAWSSLLRYQLSRSGPPIEGA